MENYKIERFNISVLFLIQLTGFFIYVIRLMVPPTEMTIEVFNTTSVWVTISLIPVIIPIIFDNKTLKWITLLIGGIVTLINIMLPVLILFDNRMKEPIIWTVMMIMICGASGVIGNIKIIKWLKQ